MCMSTACIYTFFKVGRPYFTQITETTETKTIEKASQESISIRSSLKGRKPTTTTTKQKYLASSRSHRSALKENREHNRTAEKVREEV